MKSLFHALFYICHICWLAVALCGCNGDVFIDDFAPSTYELQMAADGTASTIRFKSDQWDVRGLYLEKDDPYGGVSYEEILGDIYLPDGSLCQSNASLSWNHLGQQTFVVRHPKLSLTLERTGSEELRLADAENIGLEACRLAVGVGNDYDYREIKVLLEPSPRYRLDSIVYSLDSWYLRDSAIVRKFTTAPFNGTDKPWHYELHPYEFFQRSFTFAGGDEWQPSIDTSLFQMFGTEMPVVPVPQLDEYGSPELRNVKLPLSNETYEFPLSDELRAVCDTVVVPPGKQVHCTVKCWYYFTGIAYKIYASCPQTGRRRVLEGRADLYDPQGYSLMVSDSYVKFAK